MANNFFGAWFFDGNFFGNVAVGGLDADLGQPGRTRRKREKRRRHILADGTVIFATVEEYQALVAVREQTTEPELHALEADLVEKPKTARQQDKVDDAIIRIADLTIELEQKHPTFAPSDTRNDTLEFVRLLLKLQADEDDEMAQVLAFFV